MPLTILRILSIIFFVPNDYMSEIIVDIAYSQHVIIERITKNAVDRLKKI